jgi:hypothetical protein
MLANTVFLTIAFRTRPLHLDHLVILVLNFQTGYIPSLAIVNGTPTQKPLESPNALENVVMNRVCGGGELFGEGFILKGLENNTYRARGRGHKKRMISACHLS